MHVKFIKKPFLSIQKPLGILYWVDPLLYSEGIYLPSNGYVRYTFFCVKENLVCPAVGENLGYRQANTLLLCKDKI